jgi:SAM-dependent methyltransferase
MTRWRATPIRYVLNTLNLVRRQEGWASVFVAAGNLVGDEARKIPRRVQLGLNKTRTIQSSTETTRVDIPGVLQQLAELGIGTQSFTLDRSAFKRHMLSFRYPRFYAGGAVSKGGFRESKILEYFVSLELLPVSSTDVVLDVASERSVFPDMVAKTIGARVLRQDLIYPPGVHGDRIGGSADALPLPEGFANKIFLHNSFEHFEGDVDTNFIAEAWRVLEPEGGVCIVPLYLSTRHQIMTDPLLDTTGVAWDAEAEVMAERGYRGRFGRFYSPGALASRVLEPAANRGFQAQIYHLTGADAESDDPLSRAYRGLRFALVLRKP